MHFGDRDYSKNGHRTILFKDRHTQQKWNGPSDLDLRKLEIIYGAECRERDRQEKIELCHMYPSVPMIDRKRKKRSLESEFRSLKVNNSISAETIHEQEIMGNIDIAADVSAIVESVYKLTNKALHKTRAKYCNVTKDVLRSNETATDLHGVVQVVADYIQTMVNNAVSNLTSFCSQTDTLEKYQRMFQCSSCKKYASTKTGGYFPSTKHPALPQSTRHKGGPFIPPYDPQYQLRSQDGTNAIKSGRKKRQAVDTVTQVELVKKNDLDLNDAKSGDPQANRENNTAVEEKSKDTRRSGIPYESNEETSEERGEKKTPPAHKSHKPKKNERGRKKEKKALRQNSDESNDSYTNTEEDRSDDTYNSSKKKSKSIQHADSDETLFETPRPIKRTPGKVVELSKENMEFYNQRKWPDGVVRYVINETSFPYNVADLRRRLAMVNSSLTVHTCTQIDELHPGPGDQPFVDYLVIDNSPDFVTGRVGGRQVFGSPELLKGGQHRQHTAMMVMAMLGFYFELARHDRDEYVKVHPRHIRADKMHHFEKIGAEATMPLPYDYESATHPPWMFWRKMGKKGISSVATYKDKDPDGSIMKSLGQNQKLLSEIDIIKINSVYGIQCMADEGVNVPGTDWEMEHQN